MDAHERKHLWSLPNMLTMGRVAAVPVLVLLMLGEGRWFSFLAALLFTLVCITDLVDGYLARKMNIVTNIGKFLDPLADKLIVITALVMLIPMGRIYAWIVVVIIAREVAVTGLRAIAQESGVIIDASELGKMKTASQISAIIPLLLHHSNYPYFNIDFQAIGSVVIWFALAMTLWSGYDYFKTYYLGVMNSDSIDEEQGE